MPAAHVQSTATTSDDSLFTARTTAAFGSSTVTGNGILVAITDDNAGGGKGPLASVSDNKSNTFILIGSSFTDANNNSHQHAYCLNANGGAGHTITANFSGTGAEFIRVVAHEVSGLALAAALDQFSAGSSETNTGVTDDAVVTTDDGEYIFASCLVSGGTSTNTLAAGAGFTEPANSTAAPANSELMCEYQIQSAQGSIIAAFTRSASGLCSMRTSTFKVPSAAGKTPYQPWTHRGPMLAQRRKDFVGWNPLYDNRRRVLRPSRGLMVPNKTILSPARKLVKAWN